MKWVVGIDIETFVSMRVASVTSPSLRIISPYFRSYKSNASQSLIESTSSHVFWAYPAHFTSTWRVRPRPFGFHRAATISSIIHSSSLSTFIGGGCASLIVYDGSGSIGAGLTSSTWNTGWIPLGVSSLTVCGPGTSRTEYFACN